MEIKRGIWHIQRAPSYVYTMNEPNSSYAHWSIQFGNQSDMLCARELKREEQGEKKKMNDDNCTKTEMQRRFYSYFYCVRFHESEIHSIAQIGSVSYGMHLSLASCITIGCK